MAMSRIMDRLLDAMGRVFRRFGEPPAVVVLIVMDQEGGTHLRITDNLPPEDAAQFLRQVADNMKAVPAPKDDTRH